MNCDISKSKLIHCEWNAFYFNEIAFIGLTLHEIKQCIVFFGTPGRRNATVVIEYITSRQNKNQDLNLNLNRLKGLFLLMKPPQPHSPDTYLSSLLAGEPGLRIQGTPFAFVSSVSLESSMMESTSLIVEEFE